MTVTAQPPYGGTVLRNGAQGPDVALVQRWLNGVRSLLPAIENLQVDGKFGAKTQAAVTQFQRANGLAADGAVGSATWEMLYQTYSRLNGGGEVWPGVSMRSGHTGATVRSAQQKLKETVAPALAVDGKYGTNTKNAVQAYQVGQGLAADGVLGRQTWARLYGHSVA